MLIGQSIKRFVTVLVLTVMPITPAQISITHAKDNFSAQAIALALRKRLSQCWTAPAGAQKAKIVVRLHFALNPDGTLQSLPQVIGSSDHPLFASTAGSAVKAVVDCQPYSFLPPGKYDLWRDITINFDPGVAPPGY